MRLGDKTRELARDLIKFMQSKFGFDRVPRIRFIFDKQNSQKSLGMTGSYDHENEEIVVYALDRHAKDILRSLAHEMMHHVQKCEGMMDDKDLSATADPNYIMHDDFLKNIEADAFERGNICFREWEAGKKGDKTMNEAKKTTNKNVYAAATDAAKKQVKVDERKSKKEIPLNKADVEKPELADRDDSGGLNKWELTVAKKIEDSQEDKKEVKVNEALKNSHYYITSDRGAPEAYAMREEKIYNELLKKFKIKK